MKPLKIEFRKNGCFQMIVAGGDEIDSMIMQAMADAAAANQASLTMTFVDGVATITAEVRK